MTISNSSVTQRMALATCIVLGAFVTQAYAQDEAEGPSLSVSATYTGDFRRNTTGGLQTGEAYSDMLDLGVTWTTDQLFTGTSMTTNLGVMYLGGDDISGTYVGDLQGINNIEADNGWILYEVWTEFAFGGRTHPTVRAGVLDLNAEFDAPETTGLFVGSPHGIGTELSQTGSAGPSIWPVTGLGIRAAGAWQNGFEWRFGAYDGSPGSEDGDGFANLSVSSEEGALLIGELAYRSERFNKISLGVWNYTAKFDHIDAELDPQATPGTGNRGFYTLVDMSLGQVGDADLDAALRFGSADPSFNPVDRYVGAAFTAANIFPNRPDDSFGIAVAYAHLGDEYRATQAFNGAATTSSEISYELIYSVSVAPWLTLKPGVQFVNHPGADASLDDSWVAGIRFELTKDHAWLLSARREDPSDKTYARTTTTR